MQRTSSAKSKPAPSKRSGGFEQFAADMRRIVTVAVTDAVTQRDRANQMLLVDLKAQVERLTLALAPTLSAKQQSDAAVLTKRDAMLAELDASAKTSPAGHGDMAKRGEAALVEWTKDKEMLVSSPELATAWGLTRQGLAEAADRNELFLIKIRRRLWAPAAFVGLERDAVAAVCSAMAGVDPKSQVIFWKRKHGGLGDKTITEAIRAGQLPRVLEISKGWLEELGRIDEAAVA
jgi:hypothetical protein